MLLLNTLFVIIVLLKHEISLQYEEFVRQHLMNYVLRLSKILEFSCKDLITFFKNKELKLEMTTKMPKKATEGYS